MYFFFGIGKGEIDKSLKTVASQVAGDMRVDTHEVLDCLKKLNVETVKDLLELGEHRKAQLPGVSTSTFSKLISRGKKFHQKDSMHFELCSKLKLC